MLDALRNASIEPVAFHLPSRCVKHYTTTTDDAKQLFLNSSYNIIETLS